MTSQDTKLTGRTQGNGGHSSANMEARFLEAQAARTAALSHSRQKRVALIEFWKEIHEELQLWRSSLDRLTTESANNKSTPRSEAVPQLEELQRQLRGLRRKALSPSSECPELPDGDVRLLHTKFTSHAQALEQAKTTLCPPSKFVFKRYREALEKREIKETEKPESQAVQEKPTRRTTPQRLNGNMIHDMEGAQIVIHDRQAKVTLGNETKDITLDTNVSTLSLQKLTRCSVTVYVNIPSTMLASKNLILTFCSSRNTAMAHTRHCTWSRWWSPP